MMSKCPMCELSDKIDDRFVQLELQRINKLVDRISIIENDILSIYDHLRKEADKEKVRANRSEKDLFKGVK